MGRGLAKIPVYLYRLIVRPALGGGHCRFQPSCSAYATQAVDRHGAMKGGMLAFFRLLRCHPFYRGGRYDPVPETFAWRDLIGYKSAHSVNRDRTDADE